MMARIYHGRIIHHLIEMKIDLAGSRMRAVDSFEVHFVSFAILPKY